MTFSLLPAFLRSCAAALALLALLPVSEAQAASDTFNGGAVSNCSYASNSRTYTCSALSTSNDITIASGYTVVLNGSVSFNYNQQLNMSGTAKLQTSGVLDIGNINPSNLSITGGSLVAGTNFKVGAQAQTITADISAASMDIGTGSATKITGSLSANGAVNLASNVTIIGPITGSTVNTNSPVVLTGDVIASNSFSLASGSTMTGNIVAPNVTIQPSGVNVNGIITSLSTTIGSGNQIRGDLYGIALTMAPSGSTVTGNVTMLGDISMGSGDHVIGSVFGHNLTMAASNAVITGNVSMWGDVDIGSGDTINGNLSARNVVTQNSDGYISGNANVNALTLNFHGRVGGNITCTGSGASGCSCVTNNSGYTSGPNAPVCGAPAATLDHILVTHSGAALTCQPQTVTITACANAACSSNYSSPISVVLQPGGQTFSITGTGSGTVQQSSASTATISATSASGSPTPTSASTCLRTSDNSSSCSISFSQTNFDLVVPDQYAMTSSPPSGTSLPTLTLRALQQGSNSNTCTAALTGTIPVKFLCSYRNPSTANPTASASTIAVNGSALTACDGVTQSTVNVSFDNTGQATPTVNYPDVGQLNLRALYTTATGRVLDNNDDFVVGPAGFKITATSQSGKPCSTDSNLPGNICPAINETSAAFSGAGQPFSTTISAINKNGNVTPNFGRETSAESIDLTESLYAPSGGAFSASTPLWSSISNGAITANNMYVDEVGIAKFQAILHNASYLGSSLTRPLTILNVGRFIPDHFGVAFSAPVGLMACATVSSGNACPAPNAAGTFVYSYQPFDLTLTAYALAHSPAAAAKTSNYNGAYARIDNTSISVTKSDGSAFSNGILAWRKSSDGSLLSGTNAGLAAAMFNAGAATSAGIQNISGTNYDRHPEIDFSTIYPAADNTIKPPATLYLKVSDLDGATGQSLLSVVSGRLLVKNTYGAPTSYLPVTVEAQYWTGSAYASNGAYNNSVGVPLNGNIYLLNCTPKGGTSGACGTAPALPANTTLTFAKGSGSFLLTPLTTAAYADLQFVLPPPLSQSPATATIIYLPGTTGRLTFGVYKAGPVIYMREVF